MSGVSLLEAIMWITFHARVVRMLEGEMGDSLGF